MQIDTEPTVHKDRKMKDSNKNYQNYINKFHKKGTVLTNPPDSRRRNFRVPRSRDNSMTYTKDSVLKDFS